MMLFRPPKTNPIQTQFAGKQTPFFKIFPLFIPKAGRKSARNPCNYTTTKSPKFPLNQEIISGLTVKTGELRDVQFQIKI